MEVSSSTSSAQKITSYPKNDNMQKSFYEMQKDKKIEEGKKFFISNKEKYESKLCHNKGKQTIPFIITNTTRKIRKISNKLKQIELAKLDPSKRVKVPVDGVSKYFRNTLNEFHVKLQYILFPGIVNHDMDQYIDQAKLDQATDFVNNFFTGSLKQSCMKIRIKDVKNVPDMIDMAFDGIFHDHKLPNFITRSSLSIYDFVNVKFHAKNGKLLDKKPKKSPFIEQSQKRKRPNRKRNNMSSSSSDVIELPSVKDKALIDDEPKAKRHATYESKELQSPSAPNSPLSIESVRTTITSSSLMDPPQTMSHEEEKMNYLEKITVQLMIMYNFFMKNNDMSVLVPNQSMISEFVFFKYRNIESIKLDFFNQSYNSIAKNLWNMMESDLFYVKSIFEKDGRTAQLQAYTTLNNELASILKVLLFK